MFNYAVLAGQIGSYQCASAHRSAILRYFLAIWEFGRQNA